MSIDYKSLARPGVQNLAPYVPGKPTDELQRELGLDRIVKLASNENPLGASPAVAGAMQNLWHDIARYPDGNGFKLKEALSRKFAIEPECITLGNGSNDVLELVARAFVDKGDAVVFSEHAFAVYPIVTQAVGGQAIVVPAKDYGHDLAAMADAVTEGTKVMFVANPNNPTGTWSTRDAVVNLLEAVPPRVIVVLDEAYFEYVTEADYPNGLDLLSRFPNLVVTRTFSKIFGLASLRVGYGFASAEITDVLNRVRQPFNVNAYAQAAAVASLKDRDFLSRSRKLNEEGLAYLVNGFRDLDVTYIPSVGNFITFMVKDAEKVYDGLLHKGVIVRPVAGYGIPDGLRVTVGTVGENRVFLKALKDVIAANS